MKSLSSEALSQTASTLRLAVGGMTCASCVARVEKAISKVPGVESASVNLANEQAEVRGQEIVLRKIDLIEAIGRAGYTAAVIDTDDDDNSRAFEKDLDQQKYEQLLKEKYRLLIALALTAPLVLPMLLGVFGIHLMLPGWLQLLLALPVQFWLGGRFYRGAWLALRSRSGNMDLLVALGTSAAFGLSTYLLAYEFWLFGTDGIRGENLYYESSSVIISFVLIGKYLESSSKRQVTSAIRSLAHLRPREATVLLEDGTEETLPLERLKVGNQVTIRPGQKIPVDGQIVSGMTQVDESLVTGESLPAVKNVNDSVIGGSVNLDGFITVAVRAVGAETTLSQIIRLMESAAAAKAPIQHLVDRVAAVFVPVVICIAFATTLGWGLASDSGWSEALINGIAVLVIACPCALGLATPVSLLVGTGAAARAGILIRDAEVLEIAHDVTTVLFDKTGTLTEGKPEVSGIIPLGSYTEKQVLATAAAVQAGSEHPLAKAILDAAGKSGLMPIPSAGRIQALAGLGVTGFLNGNQAFLGNRQLMEAQGVALTDLGGQDDVIRSEGKSIAYLAIAGPLAELQALGEKGSQERSPANTLGADGSGANGPELMGMIGFTDAVRASSQAALQRLHDMKIDAAMVTGDHAESASRVGKILGINQLRAAALPRDKAAFVSQLREQGAIVAMVGDGINDAPALAAANVGIAMASGTDIAMEAAGITLMRSDPLAIPAALEISRKTYRKIKQNLFWAFIYNVIGIPLAAAGLLNPMLAGAAMALSSVSVIANALTLKGWQPYSGEANSNL